MFKEIKEKIERLEQHIRLNDWEVGEYAKEVHKEAFTKSKIEGAIYGAAGTLAAVTIGFGISKLIKK